MALDMYEEIRELRAEAAACGIATVIWSYPRGEALTKAGETAVDVTAYAAHIAAMLGAHIIKVKLPTDHLEQAEAKKVYERQSIPVASMAERVRHVVEACFAGRRLVVFSGGAAKGEDAVLDDARAILAGGGNGSIIGRNSFQRPRDEALKLLGQLVDIYKGRA
jgi:class I fructose-bisphosphate aldolase